ncbi:MAG: alpha/beta hydrolase [Chitinophagales bacterium]|nr:alpha/beta hydrolase [Chitinophagales bacterium]
MNQSISYYITKSIIKLKGIKKDFSQDPINYKKIRREDIHHLKGGFFRRNEIRKFKIQGTLITEIKGKKGANRLLIFVHGGAFISGPAKHHWDSLKEIVKCSNCTSWMCDYPKAPENKIQEISKNIDAVYSEALKTYSGNQIILIGDSAGGTLVTALTQRLIRRGIELPKRIILISPVMDSTMTNPEIEEIDKIDPMLSKAGVLSAKKMCAGVENLSNEMISPINGNFKGFPKTTIFVADNDITYPDQILAIKKMEASEVKVELIEGENMPHIWPLLPVMKEAKTALKLIINRIEN